MATLVTPAQLDQIELLTKERRDILALVDSATRVPPEARGSIEFECGPEIAKRSTKIVFELTGKELQTILNARLDDVHRRLENVGLTVRKETTNGGA